MKKKKKIENERTRKQVFERRHKGLLKKASELAALCDADVALIIFSSSSEDMFQYFSSDMTQILTKFMNSLDSIQLSAEEIKPEVLKEVSVLKKVLERIKSKQRQLLVRDLWGSDMADLCVLEEEMNSGLLSVREKKEALIQQIALSGMQQQADADDPSTSS